jgi:hypothetical protein
MSKTDADFVPAAVKKQAEAAEVAQKNAKEAKKANKANADKPAEPVVPAAPVSDPGVKPVDPTAAPAIAVDPKVVPAVIEDPNKGPDGFEQKYNVLKGMYNKDTHELKLKLESMQTAMDKTDSIIANLNNVIEKIPAAQAPAAPVVQATQLIDPKLFDGYGPEMVDAMGTLNGLVARIEALENATPQQAAAPDSEFVQRLDNIEATQQVSVKDTFYAELGAWNADWGVINHDPKFALWLEEIDVISQVQRKILLQYAFKQWNHKQVIALFSAFHGPAPVTTLAPEAPAPGLAAQVVPENTGNAGDNPAGQPKVEYATKDDFLKAKDDFVKGRIMEADFDKISNSYQTGLGKQQ